MIHEMKLNDAPFYAIKSGLKTVEMRLCDRKRQLINIGDEIEFTHRENGEKLLTRVVNLTKFPSFKELYEHFDKSSLGYDEKEKAHHTDMSQYYSQEDIDKYGTLAIEICVINV